MRVEICDVQLHAPSPALAKVLSENKQLKTKNNFLEYLAIGAVVVGVVCLVVYVGSKEKIARINATNLQKEA